MDSVAETKVSLPVGATVASGVKFKRYNNRKLYSIEKSTYVNVGEVVDVVLRGERPVVVNAKGEDITVLVLAQGLAQEVESMAYDTGALEKVMSVLRQLRS